MCNHIVDFNEYVIDKVIKLKLTATAVVGKNMQRDPEKIIL